MAINPSTNPTMSGRVTTPNADYPYGSAFDESGPGVGDGTPYFKARADDLFGMQQALLQAGSIVPSGNADTSLVSQYLQAIVQQAMGRAQLYDDTGVADVYVAALRANQHPPAIVFEGMQFKVVPNVTNTGASTLDISVLKGEAPGTTVIDIKLKGGTADPGAGDIVAGEELTLIYRIAPGIHAEIVAVSVPDATLTTKGATFLPRKHLSDCILAPNGTSTLSIGAGQLVLRNAADNDHKMINPAAITKTTGAWAVGDANGGLSTGVIANSTWYWAYEIMRSDTGVIDAMIDPSPTAPTLPTDYDFYRLIGPVYVDGSGNFAPYIQRGNDFIWSVNTTAITSTSGTATLRKFTDGLPDGMIAKGYFNVSVNTSGAPSGRVLVRHWDPAHGSTSVNENDADFAISVTTGDARYSNAIEVYCNAAQEIYNRTVIGAPGYRISCRGFNFDRHAQ